MSFFGSLFGGTKSVDKRVTKAAAQATGPLAEFYRHAAPAPETPLTEVPMLAVDVETTGFVAGKDRLLSIGWVALDGLTIDLSISGQALIAQPPGAPSVGPSATIHGLTDDQLAAQGVPFEEALPRFLEAAQGRAMLAHFARIETTFLSHETKRLYGADFVLPVADTIELHQRYINRGHDVAPAQGELRLWTARTVFNLPRYKAHNALTDALACAELYVAQAKAFQSTRSKPMLFKEVQSGRY